MTDFFPPRPAAAPTIYAFASTHPDHAGLLKVGYTERAAGERVAEQFPGGLMTGRVELVEPAMRPDGSSFTDRDVHRHLARRGVKHVTHEVFRCTVDQVRAAVVAVRDRTANAEDRTLSFGLRPEQRDAVGRTADYFRRATAERPGHTPHFLWNAKMRFGKTFAAYQLAKAMGWRRVLVLTFKPAVVHAWAEDLQRHVDFEGWQFVAPGGPLRWADVDGDRPIVCFGSFQDYLGRTKAGAIKPKNEWVHATAWDCVILDEYHYGAWRENAKGLFGADEEDEGEVAAEVTADEKAFDESILPITTGAYLYLSGTPFRALASGEFIEEQIFNWTYSDEQRAKRDFNVVVAAGARAGIGAEALPPVLDAMDEPLTGKSITLSCGKLTTGVTVRPWAGLLMLRKCSSPETYFQSAFRVQSPWTTSDEDRREIVVKPSATCSTSRRTARCGRSRITARGWRPTRRRPSSGSAN